jgi:hypothetical protein
MGRMNLLDEEPDFVVIPTRGVSYTMPVRGTSNYQTLPAYVGPAPQAQSRISLLPLIVIGIIALAIFAGRGKR